MTTDRVSCGRMERLDVGTEVGGTVRMLLRTLVGWITGVETAVNVDKIGMTVDEDRFMLTDLMDVE